MAMLKSGLNRAQWIAVVQACAFFAIALGIVQPLSTSYATEVASNGVSDIILSNIPVYNVDAIFVYGMFLFLGFVAFLCFQHPRRIPFTLNAVALFVVIRSVFVSLTHVGPFLPHMSSQFGPTITHIFFGSDFFFSGHTGAPFLLALIYWREKAIRTVFLLWSMVFATVVLLGHVHYSIDVASAYFITYTIYHIALNIFSKSREWFLQDDPVEKQAI
ncbi:MAG: hypothetical protein JWO50_348 [Candidatus Kaiserbacteria bacterium]|nr:hypothetical protein [Candidatus Kaiserbacteria bacterium]